MFSTHLFTFWLHLVLWSEMTGAVRFFADWSAPAGLSATCYDALAVELPCSPLVPRFRYGGFYSESILDSSCTPDCESALASYQDDVVSACSSDTWEGYGSEGSAPLGIIPSVIRYHFSYVCLRDNDRWCNVLAGAAAFAADPGDSAISYTNMTGNGTEADECDMCFIKSLGLQASVPYYDGPAIISQSLYESKTSSCQVKDMPRTSSAVPTLPTVSDSPDPAPLPCAGSTYTLQPDDDCHLVSLSQSIGTAWLLSDNQLGAWCNDFPKTGSLCLVNKCDVITVQANATCHGIARSANITEVLLKAWNPVLNAGCYNIDRMAGDQLCISPPGDEYEDPPPLTLAPTMVTTAAPVPTDVAQGTSSRCGMYYQVQPDEYCNLLVIKHGISLDDFLFLNPSLYTNCTNLFAHESYCFKPVGDINTYSGKPGWRPTDASTIPFTSVIPQAPATTTRPIVDLPPKTALAKGTRNDCYRYFNGADFQDSSMLEGTSWVNQCQRVADLFGVSYTDFALWNSGLANITSPDCTFDVTFRYCGKQYRGEPAPEPTGPGYEFPIREGAIASCTEYVDVPSDWDCTNVLDIFELTTAQFYEYNPAIGSQCQNLWPDMAYCIRAPGYNAPSSPVTATATATSTASPPAPTHSGQPASCNKWHVVEEGDTCRTVPSAYGVAFEQFLAWNPAVSSDCVKNFWIGQAYCVGISPSAVPSISYSSSSA